MSANHEFHHREVERGGWTEVFLTYLPRSPLQGAEPIADACEAMGARARELGIEVLQEKLLGQGTGARELGFEVAQPASGDEGRPHLADALSGIQLVGARSQASTVRTLAAREAGGARVLETPTHRRIYLSSVSGHDPEVPREPAAQAERMFRGAQGLLQDAGSDYLDVVRTWIYLPRLLDWYPEFNRARDVCYRDFGIFRCEDGRSIPASTGIQGHRRDGAACFMDALALSLSAQQRRGVTAARTSRQNEATEYGSSFSRGMTLAFDGPATCYVSGTASIDRAGTSIHVGDPQGQVVETYLNVAALLEAEGMGLGDICQATAYCKDAEILSVWGDTVRLLGLSGLPVVPALADVCRPELLFELEAVAVRGPLAHG